MYGVEYGVPWGGYYEIALVSLSPLSLFCNLIPFTIAWSPLLKYPICLVQHVQKYLSKHQHCTPDLLISSFHLWQERWDAAPRLLKAGGGQGERHKEGEQSVDGRQKQAGEDSNSAMHWLCLCQPHCEPGWLKLLPRGEKRKEKSEAIQSSAPSLSSLSAWYTSLQCPAGTNYSILMRTVPISCFWPTCYLPYICWLGPPQLNSPFLAVILPQLAWCSADILFTESPAMGKHMYGGIETHVRRMQRTVGPSSQRTKLAGDGLELAVFPLLVKSLGTKMNDHICSKHPTNLGMFLDKGSNIIRFKSTSLRLNVANTY